MRMWVSERGGKVRRRRELEKRRRHGRKRGLRESEERVQQRPTLFHLARLPISNAFTRFVGVGHAEKGRRRIQSENVRKGEFQKFGNFSTH